MLGSVVTFKAVKSKIRESSKCILFVENIEEIKKHLTFFLCFNYWTSATNARLRDINLWQAVSLRKAALV